MTQRAVGLELGSSECLCCALSDCAIRADLLLCFPGAWFRRQMACPFCGENTFLGEWLTPKELQCVPTKLCQLCRKDVPTMYLVQPREKRKGEGERALRAGQARTFCSFCSGGDPSLEAASSEQKTTGGGPEGRGCRRSRPGGSQRARGPGQRNFRRPQQALRREHAKRSRSPRDAPILSGCSIFLNQNAKKYFVQRLFRIKQSSTALSEFCFDSGSNVEATKQRQAF